jgi:hypothetical protein
MEISPVTTDYRDVRLSWAIQDSDFLPLRSWRCLPLWERPISAQHAKDNSAVGQRRNRTWPIPLPGCLVLETLDDH